MFSLITAILGTLLSLAGLLAVVPQVKARQIDGASIGAWLFRAGILVLLVGEGVAFFARPESPLVFKVMLVSSAAITFVGLTLLTQEWQQAEFRLGRSFSWQVVMLGLGSMLTAILFIEALVMAVGLVAAFFCMQYVKRKAAAGQLETMGPATLALRIGVIFITVVLLFR